MVCPIADEVGAGIACYLPHDRFALRGISVDRHPGETGQRHRFSANVALLRIPLGRHRRRECGTGHVKTALRGRLDEPAVESNAVTAGTRHGLGLLVEALHAERSTNGSSASS